MRAERGLDERHAARALIDHRRPNISILCVQLKRWTRRFLVLNRDDKLARDRSAMKPFEWSPPGTSPMDEKRPLRRQPEDHNFGSLIMLAVTAGAFLLVVWVATKALFFFLQERLQPLENRLAKARPCFERLSRIGDVRRCGDGLGRDRPRG
jgi:hypothetical protein